MRTTPFLLALLAATNIALQAPLTAYAAPQPGVQPVPYAPSQPTPVGAPPPPPLPPLPAAPPPLGASAGNDVIVLKGGGMLRGRLVEVIPNDHATIALSTGQNAIVEWSRIDRIEQQPVAPAPVPGPGVPMPPPPQGAAGKAWVHLEADHDLVLEGRPRDSGWGEICSAPCDREAPLDYEYRITGPGVRTSHDFRLAAAPGERVIVTVKAASKSGFVGGVVLVSVSPIVMFVGLIVALVGAVENTSTETLNATGSFNSTSNNSGNGTETTGWVITLVGVAGLVTGIILVASNGSTKQTEEVMRPGAPPPRRDDAWLRLPTWHQETGVDRSMPPVQAVPIFSRSF